MVSVCRKACILWKQPIAATNLGSLWKLWDKGCVRRDKSEREVNNLAASKDPLAERFTSVKIAKVITGLR